MSDCKETIEVLYALTDKKGTYSKFAGTSICSLLENTKEKVHIHLFHDGSIQGRNKENFEQMVASYGQNIFFYNVRELLPEVWQEAERIMAKAVNDSRYTEAALYRLLAPQILPRRVERLIYLDADTLVHMDIKELWQEPIGSNGMSAVFESDLLITYGMRGKELREGSKKLQDHWKALGVNVEDGFNSGVLLMDLQLIRPMGNLLLGGLKTALNCDAESNFYDQNILLYYFAEHAHHLPWQYNILQHWERKFQKARDVRGIYHYMGRSLGMDEEDIRDTLYYDYFLKTPWADGRFICHFHKELMELHAFRFSQWLEKTQILLSALLTKKPIIAASDACMSKVVEMLGNSAEAPTLSPKGLFCKLGEDGHLRLSLPYDVDEHFYLFFVADYAELKVMLEQAGLPEHGHFMDGSFLLDKNPLEKYVCLSKFFENL